MAALMAQLGVWKASDLSLQPRSQGARFASRSLGKFGNHAAMIAHREGDGSAELHRSEADVFVVQAGTARLIVGGSIVNGRATGPGEIRGASIMNGMERELSTGDIVHIAANTPHRLVHAKGFTYLAIKVSAR